MEEEKRPMVAQILDNLMFWLFMAASIGFLYMVWASFEILNHYVVNLAPYAPNSPVPWR